MGRVRLFVAVWPPRDVVDALTTIPRPELAGVRWTTPAQWHVTVRFLGEVPAADVEATVATWQAVAAGLARRTVRAGPATACFGRSVLLAPVQGLEDVVDAGHLTLARGKGRTDLRRIAGEPFDATWTVDELTLVRSDTKSSGAVYDVIARWPLG